MTKRRLSRPLLLGLTSLAAAIVAIAFAAFAPPAPAGAQRLRAQIFITQAAVPRGLSEKALIGFARGHQARTLNESTEADIATRRWLGNMVISFNAPPGDLEYHALYYDTTDGARDFVDDMAIYISDRAQRTYLQRISLARPRFRPNRRYEVVVTVRRAEVGTARFDTRGEEPRRSGMVDFTEGSE